MDTTPTPDTAVDPLAPSPADDAPSAPIDAQVSLPPGAPQTSDGVAEQASPSPARSFSLTVLLIISGVALAIGVGLGVGLHAAIDSSHARAAADAQSQVLTAAYSTCGSPDGITVGDAGQSLTIDGKGEKDAFGASIDDIGCLLGAIDVPDYVLSQMSATRALDGTLSASWEGISASWSYHPDSGLSINAHLDQNAQ